MHTTQRIAVSLSFTHKGCFYAITMYNECVQNDHMPLGQQGPWKVQAYLKTNVKSHQKNT